MTDPVVEVTEFWNSIAREWEVQTGHRGDRNRRFNSDPVLKRMLGQVQGKRVLDAGCGTGYLSSWLSGQGALVTGVDISREMIEIARGKYPGIRFHVDSCSELITQGDGVHDSLISNYVLMDLPDLKGAAESFFRVLKPEGSAVVVFSHPCFPLSDARELPSGEGMSIEWPYPYFQEMKRVDPPWGHFTREFIRFHRPLSVYWKTFAEAGFTVAEFDEPYSFHDPRKPCSVAFRLVKPKN